MKKLLLLFCALLCFGGSKAWATDISVGTATGTFYKDGTTAITPSSSNQFAKKWVSTATPTLTITCGSNDMIINSSDATDTKFRMHTDTYTLSIDGAYLITGYSITAYASNGSSKINGTTVGNSDANATTVSQTGLTSKTATITVSGTANPWMYIKSFTVTIAPSYTVTYTIVDGAATVSGGSANQLSGSAPNIANTVGANASSSYNNPYCTYSYFSDASCETPITEITGACTVYAKITSTSSLPVEFASAVDDGGAQWYTLKLRDYQFYVSGETVTLSSSDITSASAQWVFTGSVCNAYVYNKEAKKYLVMSAGACALSDTPQPWILAPHQSGAGFYLYYASDYKFPFRNSNGVLAYSTGPFYETANAASFVATEVAADYSEDIVANVQPFFTTCVGSNFGLKSSVKSTYEDRVTAAATSCDADEYSALLAVVNNPSNFVYPASGYYRIKNYSTGDYVGKTGSNPTIEFANTKAASVLYLTRSGEEGSYTYTINMQGANFWMTDKNQATGNYRLDIVAPGRFTMNDFSSNTVFGYLYASGTTLGQDAQQGNASYWTLEDATSFTGTLTNAKDNTGSEHSYATLCVPFAISGLTGASAYAPTEDGSYLTLGDALSTPITKGTPVILVGATDAGTYTANIKADVAPASSPATTNALTGVFAGASIDCTDDTGTNYVLGFDSSNDNRIGFYHVDNAAFPLSANRAYLYVDKSGGSVKGFAINFDGLVDGINTVQGSGFTVQDSAIYNLAGQRMSKLQKGVNIVNGKKILVK